MTPVELTELLNAYAPGLEAELTLLRQLKHLADEQQEASGAHDLPRLTTIADAREQTMAGLVRIEHELKPIRYALASNRETAAALPRFSEVVALHRQATDLVSTIISTDRQSLQALQEAELSRRAAAQAIEAGENTLAAYRRVIAPRVVGAALVKRRG